MTPASTPVWSRVKAEAERVSDLSKLRDDPETWERMVTFLGEDLGRFSVAMLRQAIAADPDYWWFKVHFPMGIYVRNKLRESGFDEAELGIVNLDNVYVELLEAVAAEHSNT